MDIQTLKLFMETQAIQSIGGSSSTEGANSTLFSDMISEYLSTANSKDTEDLAQILGSYGSLANSGEKQEVANYLQSLIYEGNINIPPNILNSITSWSNTNTTSENMKAGTTSIHNDYESIIQKAASQYGVPEKLIESVIKHESSFNPNAVSSAGATGLMQLMPATAKFLGVSNAFDPEQNVMGGTKYLSQLMEKYNGDLSLTLAAYNAGPGNVSKYGGIPPFKETQNYVNKVLHTYQS